MVKYNDKSNIVHLYTEKVGRMSCLLPVQRSRKSAVRQVLFQPLSLVEFEADVRLRAGVYPVKEAKSWYLFRSIPYDPYKSAIAMFLAEYLHRVLQEEAENPSLFAFLMHSIQWLDMCESDFANFHLIFLMRLSRFLGIYPNLDDFQQGDGFDLMNACFVSAPPPHGLYVRPKEAEHLRNLMRLNYETMHLFTMNRVERNHCLDIICTYYRLHLPDFPDLKSLPVLQELF